MNFKPLLGTCLALLALPALAADPAPLTTDTQRQSYAIGVDIAKHFDQLGVALDIDVLARGISDQMAHKPLALSDEEQKATMATYQAQLVEKRNQVLAQVGETNRQQGEVYRADYAKQAGVVTLSSGVAYRVSKAGSGRKPTETESVEVNYEGRLIDGRVFDRSPQGQPATFKVGAVIPGFREALTLMAPGAKYQVVIPPGLAYGERGAGRDIGPNATLIFDIELLAVK